MSRNTRMLVGLEHKLQMISMQSCGGKKDRQSLIMDNLGVSLSGVWISTLKTSGEEELAV